MNNKKIKIILLLCLAITGNTVFQLTANSRIKEQTQNTIYPEKSIKDKKVVVYKFVQKQIIIVAFIGNFDFIYHPFPSLSVKDVATKANYHYIINGSFFEPSKQHAGWLSLLGEVKTPLKKDQQLSHIIRFNPRTGELNFIEYNQFQPIKTKNYLEFQSGPLIIEKNKITEGYIQQSFNGLSPYKRTLLAYTKEDRRKYFIITKQNLKLDELAKYLLTLSVFSGKTLSVINLDGGPSVALSSKNYPELNFNETAILPILLGVK